MKEQQFKVGDWVFSHFELKQIVEMENGRVTSVTCGQMNTSTGGDGFKVYPLTIENKRKSDYVHHWYEKLHAVHGNLNYPDIVRHLEDKWEASMDAVNDPTKSNKILTDLADFASKIIDTVETDRIEHVSGIRIYR